MGHREEVDLSTESSAVPGLVNSSNYMGRTKFGIQASQWEQILQGESLNLNHFLSSIVRTQIDEDWKAHNGETHLTFSMSNAKRKVKNTANWAAAWRRASEVIEFAFPYQ